jgi:hypothetical protein
VFGCGEGEGDERECEDVGVGAAVEATATATAAAEREAEDEVVEEGRGILLRIVWWLGILFWIVLGDGVLDMDMDMALVVWLVP